MLLESGPGMILIYYYLLKNPQRTKIIIIPILPLIRKNMVCFFGLLKQLVV